MRRLDTRGPRGASTAWRRRVPRRATIIRVSLCVALMAGACARQDAPAAPPLRQEGTLPATSQGSPTSAPDRIERPQLTTRPNTTLPGITIDRRNREILLDGRICIETGILEYLAVGREGKTYESLFDLDCRPQHLHAALLIAGYTAGVLASEFQGDFAPETTASRPEGAPPIPSPPSSAPARAGNPPSYLTIEAELRQPDGSWRRQPLESLLVNRSTGKPPGRLRWAFTGSFFRRDENTGEEYFIADVERSLIALWYDPTALINLAADIGNPYRSEDGGLEATATQRPPKGTPVRLVLRPAP